MTVWRVQFERFLCVGGRIGPSAPGRLPFRRRDGGIHAASRAWPPRRRALSLSGRRGGDRVGEGEGMAEGADEHA